MYVEKSICNSEFSHDCTSKSIEQIKIISSLLFDPQLPTSKPSLDFHGRQRTYFTDVVHVCEVGALPLSYLQYNVISQSTFDLLELTFRFQVSY